MDEVEEVITDRQSYEFSLLDLFYWTTLFALGIGTFGFGWGVYLTAWIAAVQYAAASWKSGRRRGWIVLMLVLALLVLPSLLLPAVQVSRRSARRNTSLNNLKQLGLALHNHQDRVGRMPAASNRDASGNPLHGWRTAILPYIEENTLYERIDHSVAWDDPANGKILPDTSLGELEVRAYHSPRSPAAESPGWETHYFAIVGEETMWPKGETISLFDVPDGMSKTIVLIEAYGRGVRWCEPRDLTMEEAIDLLMGKGDKTWVDPGFLYSVRYRGDGCYPRIVGFADGSTHTLFPIRDRTMARALLTRNGGEEIDLDKLYDLQDRTDAEAVETIINWLNIIPTALYIGLAFWPLFKKQEP